MDVQAKDMNNGHPCVQKSVTTAGGGPSCASDWLCLDSWDLQTQTVALFYLEEPQTWF